MQSEGIDPIQEASSEEEEKKHEGPIIDGQHETFEFTMSKNLYNPNNQS